MNIVTRAAAVAGAVAILAIGVVSAPAAFSAPSDDFGPVTLCVSSSVPEPATLTWSYPEGRRSHWLTGNKAEYFCVDGIAVRDKLSAEAVVHFGGPNLHQTWQIISDPREGDFVGILVEGPGGAGEIVDLHKDESFSVTASGVTTTVVWFDSVGGRPKIRVKLSPAS